MERAIRIVNLIVVTLIARLPARLVLSFSCHPPSVPLRILVAL